MRTLYRRLYTPLRPAQPQHAKTISKYFAGQLEFVLELHPAGIHRRKFLLKTADAWVLAGVPERVVIELPDIISSL